MVRPGVDDRPFDVVHVAVQGLPGRRSHLDIQVDPPCLFELVRCLLQPGTHQLTAFGRPFQAFRLVLPTVSACRCGQDVHDRVEAEHRVDGREHAAYEVPRVVASPLLPTARRRQQLRTTVRPGLPGALEVGDAGVAEGVGLPHDPGVQREREGGAVGLHLTTLLLAQTCQEGALRDRTQLLEEVSAHDVFQLVRE